MGYSAQRLAAARTVLRARATGDADVIEDAEEAVSGYLEGEHLDEYIALSFPNGLDAVQPLHLPEMLVEEFRQLHLLEPAHTLSSAEARLVLETAVRIVHTHQRQVATDA